MKLAFADRDQYIADPRFTDVPLSGLLSREYAAARRALIHQDRAIRAMAPPGDPRQARALLPGGRVVYEEERQEMRSETQAHGGQGETSSFSIADHFGNLVSVTHSVNGTFGSGLVVDGAGFVLNNRLPCFYLDDGNVNLLAPGKRTRHTISPALALKDGKPFMAWNTPGGDNQPQAMLQAFLNVVEFGMNVQEATEAANITTYQLRDSFKDHVSEPGRLTLNQEVPPWTRQELRQMGYKLEYERLTSGPINAIYFDRAHGTFWGGSSNHGEDYGIAW
jgi:gamma-glutamyltranspeptidase/glutathione hydrolase